MRRVTTVAEVRAAVGWAVKAGGWVGLVPTMGALHDGHLALVRQAAESAELVIVSIFVNPTQFDRADDLAAYPRDLTGDEARLAELEADIDAAILVFAPSVEEMYPTPPLTTVSVSSLTDRLCGASRPGHFDAVATVVVKLCNIVSPNIAVFGRKDRQQLEVIRRLVSDLNLPVAIIDAPTVREPDGVALSSRNRRLNAVERAAARALPQALRRAVETARGQRADSVPVSANALYQAADEQLKAANGVHLDYLEVVDAATLALPEHDGGRLLVAIAAYIGPVRLIDNVEIGDLAEEDRLLAATGSETK